MARTLTVDEYAFAHLLAKSSSVSARNLGWSALADADLVKVGPKGYIHGWIFVGAPGVGALVEHPRHGRGKVTHVDEHGHVHVDFGGGKKHSFEHAGGTGPGVLAARAKGTDRFSTHLDAAAAANRRGDHAAAAQHYRQAAEATGHPRIASEMHQRADTAAAKVPGIRPSTATEFARTDISGAVRAHADEHRQFPDTAKELDDLSDGLRSGDVKVPDAANRLDAILAGHAARHGTDNHTHQRLSMHARDIRSDARTGPLMKPPPKPRKPRKSELGQSDALGQVERLHESLRGSSPSTRVEAHIAAGKKALDAGDLRAADRHFAEAQFAADNEVDRHRIASHRQDVAREADRLTEVARRQTSAAELDARARQTAAEHVAAAARAETDPEKKARLLATLVELSGSAPKPEVRPAAEVAAERDAAMSERDRAKEVRRLTALATGARMRGDHDQANAHLESAAALAPDADTRRLLLASRHSGSFVETPADTHARLMDAADRGGKDAVRTELADPRHRLSDEHIRDVIAHGNTEQRGLGFGDDYTRTANDYAAVNNALRAEGRRRGLSTAKPKESARSVPSGDEVGPQLRQADSRQEARDYLDSLNLTKDDYKRIGRELSVPFGSSASKAEMRRALVEILVGVRVDGDALRRNASAPRR